MYAAKYIFSKEVRIGYLWEMKCFAGHEFPLNLSVFKVLHSMGRDVSYLVVVDLTHGRNLPYMGRPAADWDGTHGSLEPEKILDNVGSCGSAVLALQFLPASVSGSSRRRAIDPGVVTAVFGVRGLQYGLPR